MIELIKHIFFSLKVRRLIKRKIAHAEMLYFKGEITLQEYKKCINHAQELLLLLIRKTEIMAGKI